MFQIIRAPFVLGVFAAALLSSTSARAQIAISPWYIGGGYYGGGTADGNFMFGLAQVIRAEGDYNAATTQGAINYEVARSKYIENMSKLTQAYFQGREANQAFQIQKMERNRHSPETLAQAAAAELPRRLTSEELDPVTGRILWPDVLRGEEYAALRDDLERLFEVRALTSWTGDTVSLIHDDTHAMLDILRSHIEEMPSNDFVAARKFIVALDYAVITPARKPVAPAVTSDLK